MILFIFLFIILFIIFIRDFLNKKQLLNIFNTNNVVVFGKKGTGKDVLFNFITLHKKKYYSNMPYTNKNFELFSPSDLKLGNNNFENVLNDNIIKCDWNFQEGCDFFISDCGIYLPSQYDSTLHKKYSGLPLFYATSRHIGEHNVHCNAQTLARVWKALREQADFYIKCLKTIKLPFFLILKYRIYDKYSSAENDVRVVKNSIFGNSDNLKVHFANVGLVEEKYIIISKRNVKYNSRYFKDIFIN